MKQSLVRIASVVWGNGLLLSTFLLSVPPADVPIFIGLACIALVPLVYGDRLYRKFGGVALAVSLFMVALDCFAGIRIKQHRESKNRKITEQNQATNASPQEQKGSSHE